MSAGDRHWILRVMDQVSDPNFYDGVICGIAVVAAVFIGFLWWTGS